MNQTDPKTEEKQVLTQEQISEQTIRIAAQEFFAGLKYIKGASTVLSKKAIARSIIHALNNGVTTHKVKLLSPKEHTFSETLSKVLNFRTVMQAEIIKRNQLNEEKKNAKNEQNNENQSNKQTDQDDANNQNNREGNVNE